jgi:hypothetical protein
VGVGVLGRDGGHRHVHTAADDGFKVAGLQGTGIGRMAELAGTYLDLPLGIAGAAGTAIAGRLC